MPTRIRQIEKTESETPERMAIDTGGVATVFKVEGTLYQRDAELPEKICRDVGNQTDRPLMLELAGLSYLDSESASVLCRMKREQGVRLAGLHLFIGKVVELAEECERATKYLPKSEGEARAT